MFIKRLLAKMVEKTTGRKCSRCRHNCGGQYAGSLGLADFQGWKKEGQA